MVECGATNFLTLAIHDLKSPMWTITEQNQARIKKFVTRENSRVYLTGS